jgi:hypothetical protein
MPREYGIPNSRKVGNLSRALFMETLKLSGSIDWIQIKHNLTFSPGFGTQLVASVNSEVHRQFISRPDGKLMRLDKPSFVCVFSTFLFGQAPPFCSLLLVR